ncbi:lipoprotein-releasing ABC transporter permease subunit [Permianibacter sp. IMCC34836]|uniref:lipoprotein-releasing ABC transporter permease subunit n=1 Tax=Permianibacter fluminis TaxID=2738515 RepID=UPI0015530A4A|nr:lipoprotein-releasing ABC transporter permease subunit [Permianibacter fluminis]NQD37624.1 lipoprotein-releasing ABC transporter permease subunit [Permianibacter fluminis]
MFRPFSVFVGLRYTRAKRRNHFISFISLVSIGGIALGVTVLITVLSVMNGFERELQTRILGMAPHVVIADSRGALNDWPALAEKFKHHPGIEASAPFVSAQSMFRYAGYNRFGLVQGIDPTLEQQVSIVGEHMVFGSLSALKPGEFGIVLGQVLADNLAVRIGDKVSVIIPEATTIGAAGVVPRQRRFTVVGTFEVRAEMDASMAYVNIADAQALMRLGEGVHGLRLKVTDVLHAPQLADQLRLNLPLEQYTSDWTRSYGPLFHAVKMEKTMMFVLLTFIIAVAAFNIISTLVMVVTDKQSDIAILRTLGASPGHIMSVFMVQGLVNGLFGTLIGLTGGVTLSLNLPGIVAWIEHQFGVALVPGDVYFIGFLPSQLEWGDVFNVGLTAFLMCLISTIYPAWRASRVKPAEALRYE